MSNRCANMGKDSTPIGPRRTRKCFISDVLLSYYFLSHISIGLFPGCWIWDYEQRCKPVSIHSTYPGNRRKHQKTEGGNQQGGCCFQYSPCHLLSVTVFLQNEPVSYLVRDLLSKCLLFSSRLLFSCGRFLSTRKMFKRKLTSYQGNWIEPS